MVRGLLGCAHYGRSLLSTIALLLLPPVPCPLPSLLVPFMSESWRAHGDVLQNGLIIVTRRDDGVTSDRCDTSRPVRLFVADHPRSRQLSHP